MQIKNSNRLDILPFLLVIPMISHWLLPEGIEQILYISVFGVPFYIFDTFYILYIAKYSKLKNRDYSKRSFVGRISLLAFLYLLYSFGNGIAQNVDGIFLQMIDNQAFIYCALIYLLYPLNRLQIESTKYLLIPTTILLCLEIFIFSLGLMTYSLDISSESYGGIMRISTTIGAATGSAYVISCLGVICISIYNLSERWKFIILITVSLALLMLMSRTAIILWGIYVFYYIYKMYIRHASFTRKLGSILIAVVSIYAMYNYGAFDAIIERQEYSKSVDNISSGRDVLIKRSLQIFKASGGWGAGIGQTHTDKSLNNVVKMSQPCGVHNFYLGQLSEEGVVGLILVILLLLTLIRNLDYKKPIAYFVLLQILLGFQTEPIYIEFEFVCLFFFLAMLSTKRIEN